MKYLYFLVDWEGKYSSKLHEFFFEPKGFAYGLVLAFVAALVMALVYYFVLGRKVTTGKMGNWWLCGVIALLATFFISDYVIIGQEPTKKERSNSKKLNSKLTYKYSFYRSLDKAVKPAKKSEETVLQAGWFQGEKDECIATKNQIVDKLNRGGDVRYPFSINTTIWCAVFYFLFSIIFKGMSEAAKTKPIAWPYKS